MRKDKLLEAMATVAFIGRSPYFPGTLGSLAGLVFYLALKGSVIIHCIATLAVLIIGFYSANRLAAILRQKDPEEIVIDEFAGMLIVYLFIPFSAWALAAGFIIFRALDIIKFPFIKRLEKLPGGYGIMLDDIAAAIATNLALRLMLIIMR